MHSEQRGFEVSQVLLIGGGGHCRSCIDVIEAESRHSIAGIVDRRPHVKDVLGYPVVGEDTDLESLLKVARNALVAIGQIRSPDPRVKAFSLLRNLGFQLVTPVSPNAHVSPRATVGLGSIVMHGAVVNAGASIGDNVIVNTSAVVEHDSEVGSHCHLSTRAVLNGGVRLGERSFVGSGSVVFEGVSIGSGCLIPAGSVVNEDLSDGETWRAK